MKLEGRVAIVTGGARGLGRAIARKLGEEGAAVVVADVDAAGAERAAAELPRSLAVPTDVSREADIEAMVAAALARFGRLDVLVNNAALIPWAAIDEIDLAEWRRITAVNLDGVFLACRAAIPPMRQAGYGRIVNLASTVILTGVPFASHYVAAKGGVFAFTRSLATELGADGITVNSVAPGLTRTEGTLETRHSEFYEEVAARQAIPRVGEPEDIAPAVAFLASEEARWITGQMIVVDGGLARH
jgi:NAD(P)-dependent dehydrogenase (short-subunit alcohol dehydrogenase family)